MESHPINLWMHVEPMFRVLDKKITILENYSYPFPKDTLLYSLLDGFHTWNSILIACMHSYMFVSNVKWICI